MEAARLQRNLEQLAQAQLEWRQARAGEAGAGCAPGVALALRLEGGGVLRVDGATGPPPPPPPPPSRTKWTRRVPHPVLIGHAASLTPY